MKPTMTVEQSQAWRQDLRGYSWDILPCYRMFAEVLPDGAHVLELGCLRGRSLIFMATELYRLGKRKCKVFGVDTEAWEMLDWSALIANLHATPDLALSLIHFVRADIARACRMFDPASFGLVFVDADHDYDSVRADIVTSLPLVAPGGWLAGHDCNQEGVRRAVDELVGECEHYDTVWWRKM